MYITVFDQVLSRGVCWSPICEFPSDLMFGNLVMDEAMFVVWRDAVLCVTIIFQRFCFAIFV